MGSRLRRPSGRSSHRKALPRATMVRPSPSNAWAAGPSDPRLHDRCLGSRSSIRPRCARQASAAWMTSIMECYETDAPNSEILGIGLPKPLLISREGAPRDQCRDTSGSSPGSALIWLSSYDTNAMRTADSSRACHSCRSRSKVGRSSRCGRRSKRTGPRRTQSTLRCNRRHIRR
jgi:hypothetical protein